LAETHALRRNALGLGGAVIMSAALMGPAVSVYFNPQVVAANAGAATPFVFVLALVVMLVLASSIMEMARTFPGAGSFYTYVSRGIGARSGFVTGGLMFIAYGLLVPAELALIGTYAEGILAGYGVHISWIVISAAFLVLMVFLSFRGITGSLKTAAILFVVEVAVIGFAQRDCAGPGRRARPDPGAVVPCFVAQRPLRVGARHGVRHPVLRGF